MLNVLMKARWEKELVADLVPEKPMYGKQSNTWEEAGQAQGLGVDAVAQGVIGLGKDEKTNVETKFDDDFEITPLAGKIITASKYTSRQKSTRPTK